MQTFTDDEINIINDKINEYSVEDKNGCIVWNHTKIGQNPVLFVNKTRIFVVKYKWEQQYPEDVRSKKEEYFRTCGTEYCLNINHIRKQEKQKYINKEDKPKIWKRLLDNSERQGNCLIWKGFTDLGYGRITIYKFNYSTHKISFWINNEYDSPKDIPFEDGEGNRLVIRHLCGNRECLEPSHLSLGTSRENALDQQDHGTALLGEKNPSASITEEIARQIKHSKYEQNHPDYKTQQQRAELFDTTVIIVYRIDNNITWAHIPDRNGNLVNRSEEISEKRKIRHSKAKNREWTEHMWQQAFEKLTKRLMVLESVTSEHVDTPCYEWTGTFTPQGYGTYITVFGKRCTPHILACEIKNKQQRPKDMVTRHLCANKKCCNPDHLEFSTHSENSIDVTRHGTRKTIINEAIVREIRETKGNDGLSQQERAKKYNVRAKYLCEIEGGRVWKHVI